MSDLSVIEYQSKRVLTTQQLAAAYETEPNNIQMNFNNNRDRFLAGRDYHFLQGEELKDFKNYTNDIGLVGQRAPSLYLWTERGANRHSKILDTDKAWQQFDLLEETYFQVKTKTPQIPQTLPEALRAYANEVENHIKAKALLEEQKPKVLFADSVAGSNELISVNQLSKILKQKGVDIGEKRLFFWLRDNGYLCKFGDDYNLPTQRSMDLKVMEIKKSSITTGKGDILVTRTTKITGKGSIYFVNKFLNAGKLEVV